MDSIHFSRGPQTKRTHKKQAFTLVEVLITMVLVSLFSAAVLSALVFYLKSSVKVGNLAVANSQSRLFFDVVGQDIRSAVDVTKANNKRMTLTIEDPSGVQSEVKYIFSTTTGALTRQVTGERARTLIENVDDLKFYYYDSNDSETSTILDLKKIDIEIEVQSSETGVLNPEVEYKSSRFVLRNRVPG